MQAEPVARPNALALRVAQDADRVGSALMTLAIDDLDARSLSVGTESRRNAQ